MKPIEMFCRRWGADRVPQGGKIRPCMGLRLRFVTPVD
jgi:hypothetical protein